MKALTIWQPWASLIMAGAKPYEFRRYDYRRWTHGVVGRRIVIHAAARKVRWREVNDILVRLRDEPELTGLDKKISEPLLFRVSQNPSSLPLASGLGTAVISKPVLAHDLFKDQVADSDRIDQHVWAWPLSQIEPFNPFVPARGYQGFWNWRHET